ncbi:MAG: hypothetical protein ACOYOU_21405 [Kiritimatiellia bacterium]
MKEWYKGVLDLDRRSRESVTPRRVRMSTEWISLADHRGRGTDGLTPAESHRPWMRPLPLWLRAFLAGRWTLLRAAEECRRKLFREPVQLSSFLAIHYVAPLTHLQDELAWLLELGVRQTVLTVDQGNSNQQHLRSLADIQSLRAANFRVAAMLVPKLDASTPLDDWPQFCHWILSQAGWQLDFVQLGEDLESLGRHHRAGPAVASLFAHVPRLRQDYPGVALLAPWMAGFDSAAALKMLRQLLPDGVAWDGVTLRTPAWQVLEGLSRENLFLRQLTLTGATARLPEFAGRRVQMVFPPLPMGCDAAGAERMAGSVVRRTVLALCSGMVDHVAVGMDPAMPVSERQTLSTAIRELSDRLEGARFVQRVWTGEEQQNFVLEFERTGKPSLLVGWTDGEPRQVTVPFPIDSASDYLRRSVPLLPRSRVRLTRNLAYYTRAN